MWYGSKAVDSYRTPVRVLCVSLERYITIVYTYIIYMHTIIGRQPNLSLRWVGAASRFALGACRIIL